MSKGLSLWFAVSSIVLLTASAISISYNGFLAVGLALSILNIGWGFIIKSNAGLLKEAPCLFTSQKAHLVLDAIQYLSRSLLCLLCSLGQNVMDLTGLANFVVSVLKWFQSGYYNFAKLLLECPYIFPSKRACTSCRDTPEHSE